MLEIDLPLVVLTAMVFLALIAILNPLLYKPMLKFIDERNASIKSDEESTSKNANDLSVHEKEIENIILNARAEANKIRQDALSAAKDSAFKEAEAKRAEFEADYNSFLNSLSAQKEQLKADLVANLPELKSALNSKLARI
ncbi:F0F1 ATP synthase subunit B' [Campylobacter sp. RM13119]|uniref:FoF1 ATP synthase subunit B' n=1 Tax=Campylobacter TaxID=194 RepID=UPI0014762077|nr:MULTISPECIES: FoF1 ATP synthase subunit B' [unclassified Campylobacter]MBE3021801.1 F0F1 ATP synthase subunit B' [Campylobacter sp. 7477a]MBE3606171.1 F0F1 ATP synthase subunit B' [Campylobacter sp. RM13119]MBE3609393.1 F0F1 ATP synthase subunit B' [Campylobacter sp. RM12916]